MLSKLLDYYAKRNKRERVMFWCVVCIVLLFWLSAEMKGCSRLNSEISELSAKKKLALAAIEQAPIIKRELDDILKTFDKTKTLSPVALQIAVENCARKAELVYSLSAVSTKDAGRFKINTITLSCQRGELKNLADFENEMRLLEPYVMFTRASFDGNSAGEVAAKYEISSFEFIEN